jgi:hypothetical protein
MTLKSLPYLVGGREACQGFRNLEAATGGTGNAADAR